MLFKLTEQMRSLSQNPFRKFGIAFDCAKGDLPELFVRIPASASRFQSVTQCCLCERYYYIYNVIIAVAYRGRTNCFRDNDFDCFYPDLAFLIISISDAEKFVSVLIEKAFGAFLTRFQVCV